MRNPTRAIICVIGKACLLAGFSFTAMGCNTGPAAYTVYWADEFDVDGPPDPSHWTYETEFVRNHELQWYQSSNAFCQGGLLVIEANVCTQNDSCQSGACTGAPVTDGTLRALLR